MRAPLSAELGVRGSQTIAACEEWNKRLLYGAFGLLGVAVMLPVTGAAGLALRAVPVLAGASLLFLREEIDKHRQKFFHQDVWGKHSS